ncbi:MAG: replication-associated recombination protein A [Nitrospirales bacterium]|nr:replication-associated recombination protein A [Nitrospirales bacterium]
MDLFSQEREEKPVEQKTSPLAYRMAPRSLEEYAGQRHILGEGKLLRRAVDADRITSLILFGPPGTGKTAMARVIATRSKARLEWLNAATAGLDDLRKVIQAARMRRQGGSRTILFLDEIHRFNKLQQDALLPDVEEGNIILIAATVENPYFSVNSALLSRSHVFELKPLLEEDLREILLRALKDKERGLGNLAIELDDEALGHIARMSDGDARKALSALEVAALTTPPGDDGKIHITLPVAEESIQKKAIVYDKTGDQHYDTISAFIKSMRGSDPDAALYYLAKMLTAGEDPRFIARRIVICASEDVGEADPMSLLIATAALRAVEFIGMPEARITLSQAVIHICTAPKSNACYRAIEAAMEDVEKQPTLEVPDHLKDSHYPGAKELGHGKGYKYPHAYGGHVEQEYLPQKKKYYNP